MRLIEDYKTLPEAADHWGRELEVIEAGEEFTFCGWQCRGRGAPVDVNTRYRLTADDEIVPDARGSFD